MKTNYIINKISMTIIHVGLSVCTAVCTGIFFYFKEQIKKNTLDISQGVEMLEHAAMGVFLVLAIALVFDIHTKFQKQ